MVNGKHHHSVNIIMITCFSVSTLSTFFSSRACLAFIFSSSFFPFATSCSSSITLRSRSSCAVFAPGILALPEAGSLKEKVKVLVKCITTKGAQNNFLWGSNSKAISNLSSVMASYIAKGFTKEGDVTKEITTPQMAPFSSNASSHH